MQEFSELLGMYIRERGFTNNYFAKCCNMDRTLLQKYLSGQRFPSNQEMLDTIYEQLRLSPSELELINEAHERKALGADYQKFYALEEMLEEYSDILNPSYVRDLDNHIEELVPQIDDNYVAELHSRQEILGAIGWALGAELGDPTNQIYMIFQPGYEELDMLLKSVSVTANTEFHHIVCLDPRTEAVTENLEILRKMIPLICSPMKYNIHYYYGQIKEHINTMNLLPNLILTDLVCIRFDYEMKNALLNADQKVKDFYKDIFRKMQEKCKPLTDNYHSLDQILGVYMSHQPAVAGIGYIPCFSYTITPEIMKDIIYPEFLEGMEMTDQTIQFLKNYTRERRKNGQVVNTHFYPLEGIDFFIETGIITEYPRTGMKSVPKKWRLYALKKYLEQMKGGLFEGHIFKEGKYHIGQGLGLEFLGNVVLLARNNRDGSQTIMEIKESGIVKVVSDYLEYLQDSKKVYSHEETIAIVEAKVEKWTEKYMK